MSIPLVREPISEFPEPEETCCFCGSVTPFWYKKKDVAVCKSCAKTHKVSDVPTKQQWCKETRKKLY